MPRAARLDIPGILQHVIIRGIERRDIFFDDHDRGFFTQRLSLLLEATETRCFAWSLLSNHCHFLLMPAKLPLSYLMRRLLTGYAVVFNRKYNRSGHLFQNRFKSIVCEEEPYLLELVRYIHLNPLRAGLVSDLQELDRYPWSGHATLMGAGGRQLATQEIKAILSRFGRNPSDARLKYGLFIAEGIPRGRRDDLVGGGRRRSQGDGSEEKEYEMFDERVLGSGTFVEELQRRELLRGRIKPLSLGHLLSKLCEIMMLDPDDVRRPSKIRALAEARGVLCYLAIREIGYKGIEVGSFLCLGPTGVTLATRRGEKILNGNQKLKKALLSLLNN